jgi:hypothetical protein
MIDAAGHEFGRTIRDIGEDRRLILCSLLDDVGRNALEVADNVTA